MNYFCLDRKDRDRDRQCRPGVSKFGSMQGSTHFRSSACIATILHRGSLRRQMPRHKLSKGVRNEELVECA